VVEAGIFGQPALRAAGNHGLQEKFGHQVRAGMNGKALGLGSLFNLRDERPYKSYE
jgi:hypothetical protein